MIIFFQYSLPREEKRDVTKNYNKYTIKKLQDMAPQVTPSQL